MAHLSSLLPRITASHAYEKIREARAQKLNAHVANPPALSPFILAGRARDLFAENSHAQDKESSASSRLIVAVTASGRAAEDTVHALAHIMPSENVDFFPSWETLPHERLSPRPDTVATRMRVMRRLAHPEENAPLHILAVPVRALLQPVIAGLGEITPVRITRGEKIDIQKLEHQLIDLSYTRVDMISRRGEFASRGGIIDIFPPTDTHPSRIELFGDEVDDIRTFTITDQRSIEQVDSVYAPACREISLTQEVRDRARDMLDKLPGAADMLEKIAEGIAVEGMESLAPALVDSLVPLASLLPQESEVWVIEPERVAARAENLLATSEEFLAAAWSSAASGGAIPIDVNQASFTTLAYTKAYALKRGMSWNGLAAFAQDESWEEADSSVFSLSMQASEMATSKGTIELAAAALRERARLGWSSVVTASGMGVGTRLAASLSAAGVASTCVSELPKSLEPSICYVVPAYVQGSFLQPEVKLAVTSSEELLGKKKSSTREMRKMPARRKNAVDPLSLKPGDYVVHERHGVGKFVRMEKRAIGARAGASSPLMRSHGQESVAEREYLVIEYQPTKRGMPADELLVPADSLDQLSKYSGGDAPTLNKLGGADWEKTKQRARAATRQIAGELVRLYAARQTTPGYAFSPDTPWQHELEDAFEYVETPDQLHTIEEVKADMEKPVPMDRLISGDVGYGKTEIAVRAAFKAVQDSKQVAVLVPTTLLASQHYETFTERYSGFPVNVAQLSRFQSEAESKETIQGLKDGSIDVVIGTHRLLTGDIRFKDLGLVIIDEEQRFGVEHKETLKQLYPRVDVLAMSATPIPRTLEMAVTGVRELSTLATPPEERHPVLTYVGAREDKQILAAIRRELLREGQVFYIHNRTGDMSSVAAHLQELVPEARIATANGKMGESQLEAVIEQFWQKEIDVLVCTTIVETGLDISNANTLIVEDAHKFGLSQLHQLRGRVGRGRERAYAYFLYDPRVAMTETAVERLRTIAAHTDLGAGMQVAMKDLEIRGAGNMLGGEQSGHIAGVGFDLYVRMVAEAVDAYRALQKAAKKQTQEGGSQAIDMEALVGEDEIREVRVELPVEAFIPDSYVPSERLRLEIYSKIAATRTPEQRDAVREELRDRYGVIPEVVERLFKVAQLREFARSLRVSDVGIQGKYVRFAPIDLPDSRQVRLKRLYHGAITKPAVRRVLVPLPGARKLGAVSQLENDELIAWVEEFLRQIVADPQSTGTQSE